MKNVSRFFYILLPLALFACSGGNSLPDSKEPGTASESTAVELSAPAESAAPVVDTSSEPAPTEAPAAPAAVGIANPASQKCIDSGGQLEMKKDADGGEFGVCVFSDGSRCEEWRLFRGTCKMGDCRADTGQCD